MNLNTGIFLLQKDKSLIEMNVTEFINEDSFQELLQNYPNLLAGDQIDERDPRKWLLVSREVSIPDSDKSGGRWSVDHLFLDQEGIPTLVEVKRASDTRIRREVVGQLLEYAANALNYWSVDSIRRSYEVNCENKKIDPHQTIIERLQINDLENYWMSVKSNLERGKLRLLFVADEIPFELRTLVEFLNENMNEIEVLAVEIKQYTGGENTTLVPRVIGQTSKTEIRKDGQKSSRQWDEQQFMTDLEKRLGAEDRRVAEKLLRWAEDRKLDIWWGRGNENGSFFPMLYINGNKFSTFSCWSRGGIELQFQWIKTQSVYSDIEKRKSMLKELNKISGINITEEKLEVRPSIQYNVLKNESSLNKFSEIWDNYIDEIKTFESTKK